MSDKEELIISKLVKIASNQQKILQKLAQQQDPNIAYLKSAAQITAPNSGFNASSVEVMPKPGSGSDPSVQVAGGYTIRVGGAPPKEDIRQKFIRQLQNMVATQKPNQPELANLDIIFV